jgi:acyl-CoA thioesterase-1
VTRVLPIALLWLCLAACGGREEAPRAAPASPATQAPAPAADARPVIVAFGDSLSAGFGVDPGASFPDILQQELDRRGYRYRVVNQGSSGDTTSGGLARVSLALDLKPEVVILELGANDGLRGVPVTATRANLKQLIQAFQKSGARVLLAGMTLPPNYGPDYIRDFEAAFRDLAREHKTGLIPFLLDGVGGRPELMQNDGLHPNVAGNRKVAATVLRYLEPMLKK